MIRNTTEVRLQIFKRADIKGSVIIHDDEEVFIARLNNISAGGLFIAGCQSLQSGRVVRLVVKSQLLASPIQARGTVVRVQSKGRSGIAVEFTSISSCSREMIKNCVEEACMEGSLKVE